ACFVRDALAAIEVIAVHGRVVLLTGGTGLYLKALFEGLFSELPRDEGVRRILFERLMCEGRERLHAELCRIDPVAGARVHVNDTQRLLRGLEICQVSGVTWTDLIKEQKKKCEKFDIFENVFQVALTREREELYQRISRRSEMMFDQGFIEEVKGLQEKGYSEGLSSMQSIGYRHVNNFLVGKWSQKEMLEYLVRDTRRYAKRQMTWFRKDENLHWFNPLDEDLIVEQVARRLFL
ncbi:MAG: tRNA (adenosine(37)-N6)-dimethylallyltransferase MiaA, partial [Candidatus Electrothrix sp. AR3]|nr:tRNA (adenosine(37)-N6)-dimethylallyltransferase MiaA [Candidatus Electrothrix sp. AR3]